MRALISLQGLPELRTHITSKPCRDTTRHMQVPHYAKECIADPAVIARLISLKLAINSANGCAAPLAWIPLVGSRWLAGCVRI